jgi:hypothetical protein
MASRFHCASAVHLRADLVGQATRRSRERSEIRQGSREPSAERQLENLAFALGTRAAEALEDPALDVAAIHQRLERMDADHGSAARERGARPERS